MLRASGKAVWKWPRVVAVDASPMQIQRWEGATLSRAETVLQGKTHNTVRVEIGYRLFQLIRILPNNVISLTAQACGLERDRDFRHRTC